MAESKKSPSRMDKALQTTDDFSNITYDFATNKDLGELFKIYISSSWEVPSNRACFYDDEKRDDQDVRRRCRDLGRESIINTIFKTDGSGVIKTVQIGLIIGMVKVDAYSRVDIEAQEAWQDNLPAPPPRRMKKPTAVESGEKFLEHLDEWAMDWEVIRDHYAVYTRILKSYADSTPFLSVSALGSRPGWVYNQMRHIAIDKVRAHAERTRNGLLFVAREEEKVIFERCGVMFNQEEVKAKGTTFFVSWTPASKVIPLTDLPHWKRCNVDWS